MKRLNDMSRVDPYLKNVIRRCAVETYPEFIEVLYDDIDIVIDEIERNPELHSSLREDQITIQIVNMLRRSSYTASHDQKSGGHVDVTVESRWRSFVWLGEAKKQNGKAYFNEGLLQLLNRYSQGSPGRDQGGLMLYLTKGDAVKAMDTWKQALGIDKQCKTVTPCAKRDGLAFFSTHNHPRSGRPYRIRHMGVMLHFAPNDRSARKAAAR